MTDLDIDEFVRFFVLWKRLKAGRATLSWLGTGLKGHSVSIDPWRARKLKLGLQMSILKRRTILHKTNWLFSCLPLIAKWMWLNHLLSVKVILFKRALATETLVSWYKDLMSIEKQSYRRKPKQTDWRFESNLNPYATLANETSAKSLMKHPSTSFVAAKIHIGLQKIT